MHNRLRRRLIGIVVLAAAVLAVVLVVLPRVRATGSVEAAATPTPTPGPGSVEVPVSAVPTTNAPTTSAPTASARTTAATSRHASPLPSIPTRTEPPTSVATDRPAPTTGGDVDVVVTSAAWDAGSSSIQATAFVSGAIETGGTCTLTVTSGSRRVTASAGASPDATTTDCDQLQIPGGGLTSGSWQAVVSYRSARSSGASAPVTVTVP